MSERLASKYRVSSSRTSSASRDSASVVNPTRSANKTDTSRRSATGADWVAAGSGAAAADTPGLGAPASAVPHSPQNFCPRGFAVPHEEQPSASPAPHSPQNFWPDGLSAEHREQIILGEGYRPRTGTEKARTTTALSPDTDCPLGWGAGSTPFGPTPRPGGVPTESERGWNRPTTTE